MRRAGKAVRSTDHPRRRFCRLSLGFGLAAVATAVATAVPRRLIAAAETPDPPPFETLLAWLGFDSEDRQRVEAGDIVTRILPSTAEQQLRIASALLLPQPLAKLRRRLDDVAFYPPDPDLRAARRIGAKAGSVDPAWPGCGFATAEAEEAQRVRRATPGLGVNLSPSELAVLRTLAREADGAEVSAVFCQLLRQRAATYAEQGVAGIDVYDRGGGEIRRPDLALNAEARAFAARFSPYLSALRQTLAAYPRPAATRVDSRLSWRKTLIDGRPGFQLLHQLTDHGNGWTAVLTRQIYVSHSYDGLQAIAVFYDHGGTTLLIDENATTTDQIPPLFGALARTLGAAALRRTLSRHFAALRDTLDRS